jgi:hypothetical protein
MSRDIHAVTALPSILIGPITGEALMGTYTGGNVNTVAIARRAFELWEKRGRQDGHDVDDWLLAEREFTRKEGRS